MEIERKFLISAFPPLTAQSVSRVEQGYLSLSPEVRVRRSVSEKETRCTLTVKGEGTLSREETEVSISESDYLAMAALLEKPPAKKDYRRYDIGGGLVLECSLVDEGAETSFMYAEIEFPSEEDALAFTPPDYLGEEVTYNRHMRMKSYWENPEYFSKSRRWYILASKSPRRSELLRQAGVEFEVVVSDADEAVSSDCTPSEMVMIVAERKARAVFAENMSRSIISADTAVCLDGEIFGKPKSENEAKEMLKRLSGRTHQVYTGVCVLFADGAKELFCEQTAVTFSRLSEEEIAAYVSTGEPMDKAGAYGVQGRGALFVERIDGDYYNVMGLPIHRLNQVLKGHKM